MKPIEYKQFCETTYACPPGTNREEYLQLLLIEELGEVASLFAKAMRDGSLHFFDDGKFGEYKRIYGPKAVNREALIKELGDVMWCAAMLEDAENIEDWFDWPQFLDTPYGIEGWSVHTSPLEAACSMCQHYGFTPEEVALANVEKLKGRVQRGTLHGNGDER